MSSADLIVVGGGTAGCMLVHELVTRFGFNVTLIETGGDEAPEIDRLRPSRWLNLIGSAEDYDLATDPVAGLSGRALRWPRGRGLGGSSRINAMIWMPPTEQDLAMLAGAAAGTWDRQQLLEALRRVEWLVRPESPRWLSEPSTRFLDAATGISGNVARYLRFNRMGRRWTSAQLLKGLDGERWTLRQGTVERLHWQNRRVEGVVLNAARTLETVPARHGVILSAGAIASPLILQRSGIGGAEQLKCAGVDPVIDCPAVGENLQDHLIMPVIVSCPSNAALSSRPSQPRDLARWQTLGGGPIASNIAECGGLFDENRLQLHVTPTHYLKFPHRNAPPAMTIGVNVTQPRSRGRVAICSSSADTPPQIMPSYFAREDDLEVTLRGIELARQIAQRAPLVNWLGKELVPGAKRTDAESISRAIRRYSQTLYHPVGTCAMGERVEGAAMLKTHGQLRQAAGVVAGNFAVHGVDGLWVVDASVLPRITLANPSVVVLMLASVAAGCIAGDC